jgi:hypothetical protein
MDGFDWIGEPLMGDLWCSGQAPPASSSSKPRCLPRFSIVMPSQRNRHGRIYPKTVVLQALNTDPSSALPFLKLMAHQVIEARQRLELMKIRSAKVRVMLYLDLHATAEGSVRLKSELQDIASELGLTREAFYRALASLEHAGAIERWGARIVLKKAVGS